MDKNIPQHVAIIPDGNRRWAKERGLKPWRGHFKGAENTHDLLEEALDLGIKYLSLWLGSFENLTKRPEKEISFLFQIYDRYFKKLIKNKKVHQNGIKVNVFGRWEEILPEKVKKTIKEALKVTKDYNGRFLNVFLGYNGTDEMLEAIKEILKEGKKNRGIKITDNTLRDYLWTGDLPPVDFLIRTGSDNDPHNSAGFMMWNCANSQFYFAKEYYPDFNREKFNKAIKDYQRRERRLGK